MNRFEKYMTDRSVENSLSEEERKDIIDRFWFGVGSSALEGETAPDDENEFLLYCVLNNVPAETRRDIFADVEGRERIDHEAARKNREAYEEYKKVLKDNL